MHPSVRQKGTKRSWRSRSNPSRIVFWMTQHQNHDCNLLFCWHLLYVLRSTETMTLLYAYQPNHVAPIILALIVVSSLLLHAYQNLWVVFLAECSIQPAYMASANTSIGRLPSSWFGEGSSSLLDGSHAAPQHIINRT